MPSLCYNQSNGYLLLSYLEELIPADHVASMREALKAVEADIERYTAGGLAIDKAEDALYGENKAGQELPRKVKQALERREPESRKKKRRKQLQLALLTHHHKKVQN